SGGGPGGGPDGDPDGGLSSSAGAEGEGDPSEDADFARVADPTMGVRAEPSTEETSTGGSKRSEADGAVAEEPAKDAPPKRAIVEFGLRSSLRSAWVRIGRSGRPFAVDPTAERRVSAGTRTIYWKRAADDVWVDGGRFVLAPGRRTRIRLTRQGPERE
ncbi:MAG: hypothetical protein AAGF11_50750, partial [Myxococcota bacterium]